MAETDFTVVGSAAADIARGVTTRYKMPSAYGGGNFVFGFNSKYDGVKSTLLYYNPTNFAPLRDDDNNATGGSVRAALMRGTSSAADGFSVFLFINLQGTSTSDKAYLLGLSAASPSTIMLAKTSPSAGLDPDGGEYVVLAESSETFLPEAWAHLRLDAICNPNGDVILKCFKSDLSQHAVTSPSWAAISGMSDVIDDSLGILTASNPLAGGYMGFGFQSSKSQSRGFIDHFEPYRQM